MVERSKVLVVIGHGRREGLGHHLLGVVRAALEERGAEHRVHDLLADGFDPVLRLEPGQVQAVACSEEEDALAHRYQQDVLWAEAYVFLHPVWWFAPPAILKGWVDRVFVDGIALHQPETGPPEPLLSGRRALVVQTFNARRSIDRLLFRGISDFFWRRAVFLGVGVQAIHRVALYGVAEMKAGELEAHEERLRRAVRRLVGG